ncbi:TonB family protein [Lichenifustis flavocetrariae]|uniref:TonB family protein n=1 Tax=Lichenifustis flavocetrariae TaxID=2949735 RepID=A0AA41YXA0_9HYPH|nr:TonB family protein [Lichenifustis flavocetrariae]MCW6508698.1 TonB family protein [Lichenifustis flavocetrariae]
MSLLVNAAVVGWLIQVGWPLRSAPAASGPISVEIVDHVPGEMTAATAGRETSHPETKPQADARPSNTSDQPPVKVTVPDEKGADAAPEKPEEPAAEPPKQAAQPAPSEIVKASPPAGPATEPADPSPPPVVPDPTGTAPNMPQPPGVAVPPPPEHPNNDARPQLVEAPKPPGPPAVAGETTPEAAPHEPTEQDASSTEPTPPPPPVETNPDPETLVPPPAPAPKEPPEPTAEQKRQAENTATLAAMLPFGTSIAASPFQAGPTGQGSATSQAYRGAVYGAFAKAKDVVEAAQAQHLRGQAVVAFTLDDKGGLATLGIAVSSGHPDVDEAALDYIRHSAPFPPPPPGAQRSFSPAIGFGLDD